MKVIIAGAILVAAAPPATGGELFGGLYAHAVKTPLSLDSAQEGGVDVQLGIRGQIQLLKLQPYAFGTLNSRGDTSYAGIGVSRSFGGRLFVRPGIGLAIHNGSTAQFQQPNRIAFGSRILFEPELGIGLRLSPRASVEASWIHMSQGQLFSRQNPGIDNIGLRLTFGL